MPDETELQILEGVPDKDVPAKVGQFMKSKRYLGLRMAPDSPDTHRIEVTVGKLKK
jgi:hypothetical protein